MSKLLPFFLGKKTFFELTEMPVKQTVIDTKNEPESIGAKKFIPWFEGNAFPQNTDAKIKSNTVLLRALTNKQNTIVGQGIFACKIVGTGADGQEIFEPVNNPEITKFLNSYAVRKYLAEATRDLVKYGNTFIEFVPNMTGDKILTFKALNAYYTRLAAEEKGKIKKLIVSGTFPEVDTKNFTEVDLLDRDDPVLDLEIRKEAGIKGNFAMHICENMSNNPHYADVDYLAADEWIKLSNKIPKLLNAGYDNMFNILFHIKIPYSFLDDRYPEDKFPDPEIKKKQIEADMQTLEESFTSIETAKKALITFFGYNEGEKDGWQIEVIQPKFSQENFVTSTAADTQIAIAAGTHPDTIGLQHGNSKGGSMQRELDLIALAKVWLIRQKLLDPIEMILRYNFGSAMDNVELRFRGIFLTPLSTGSQTKPVLS